MKNKTGFFEKLLQKNRIVFVLALIIAIAFWTVIKINYSDQTSRIISNVAVNFDTSFDDKSDYIPFYDSDDLNVEVEVTGKGYNINAASLTKDDISVEATVGYIDTSGYKVLNLTAKSSESGVSVSRIEPSTITVFFDKKATDTFNVEARLINDSDSLAKDGFVVGAPVASMSTVDVTGPATIIQSLKKVYFDAEIAEENLPLESTKELEATVSYALDNMKNAQYLHCEKIESKTNPATITIPVSKVKTVPTSVKFVNEPSEYEGQMSKMSIYPSKVKISYNALDGEDYDSYNVGTIDFRKLTNSVNRFTFKVDDKSGINIIDSNVKQFTVTLDMSSMSKKSLEGKSDKVVLLNQAADCNYSVDTEKGGLDKITIIGPWSKINKIKEDDLQIEINVSSLDVNKSGKQTVTVSNISIQSEEFSDCWIYGTYTAEVTVSKK
ncbi:MAG: hypothetical protein NC122_10870 [Faecalibacterium sp.]|nr:hypothetical protein [Ruminococcus sp.]MCM1391625.1 hypothetical protein [Ruminococcus sp.]MCM1486692.1 hypothetical protein [Faecalibacterium sp.]